MKKLRNPTFTQEFDAGIVCWTLYAAVPAIVLIVAVLIVFAVGLVVLFIV